MPMPMPMPMPVRVRVRVRAQVRVLALPRLQALAAHCPGAWELTRMCSPPPPFALSLSKRWCRSVLAITR
jgi:hypothetical protein